MQELYGWNAGSSEIWTIYANEFKRRWGIDREVAAIIGARSKTVFAAEFQEHGDLAYKNSVILPIRNALYGAATINLRWEGIARLAPKEPVLDYGCGVGVMLLWMKRNGFNELFGYEVDGIQKSVMLSVFKKCGIKKWDGEAVETVTCMNVLEHVPDPVALLTRLMKIGNRVIANICTDHDSPHIAPHDKLEECRNMLEKSGGLYVA